MVIVMQLEVMLQQVVVLEQEIEISYPCLLASIITLDPFNYAKQNHCIPLPNCQLDLGYLYLEVKPRPSTA